MKLCLAHIDDIGGLGDLWEERRIIQAQADPRLALKPGERANWEALMKYLIAGEIDGRVMVAIKDGALIGFIAGDIVDTRVGRVRDLTLDAHTYHGGLGRELVGALRAWYAERNITQMAICVPRFHAVEQAFWRSLGADEWHAQWECSAEYIWLLL